MHGVELTQTWRVRMLCHVNIAFNPLDITWTIFTSFGFLLKYNFFKSSAAKFIAYLAQFSEI
jgi:hypothetical protein